MASEKWRTFPSWARERNVADFEDGGRRPLETGKGKDVDSPLEPPKEPVLLVS